MPFQSGRVTFCRFRVEGDAPQMVDQTTLATLAEYSFKERQIGAPDEIETGWTTGEHLLDTQFTYEKNGYGADGSLLLFALRIDAHRVPADLKHAYKRINEAALAAENPSGFVSKKQRRQAAETASDQVREELTSGKHRKSKAVPLLWDLKNGVLYCSAPSNKVIEQLASHFHRSFNCKLSPLSSGALAGEMLRHMGKGRDYEDLHPSPFTAPPEGAAVEGDDASDSPRDLKIPAVPWVQSATDMKDFLGNEFLIWLWWMAETSEGLVPLAEGRSKAEIAVLIDKALDMDCAWGVLGKQTLRAEGPTKLAEARDALATGKWPRKAGLILADTTGGATSRDGGTSGGAADTSRGGDTSGGAWTLALQADRWIISSATLPDVPEAQTPRELIDARLTLTRQLGQMMDGLYRSFLAQRVGGGWPAKRRAIQEWIKSQRGR